MFGVLEKKLKNYYNVRVEYGELVSETIVYNINFDVFKMEKNIFFNDTIGIIYA